MKYSLSKRWILTNCQVSTAFFPGVSIHPLHRGTGPSLSHDPFVRNANVKFNAKNKSKRPFQIHLD